MGFGAVFGVLGGGLGCVLGVFGAVGRGWEYVGLDLGLWVGAGGIWGSIWWLGWLLGSWGALEQVWGMSLGVLGSFLEQDLGY